MATVYRKTVTKAVPDGAELFTKKGEPFARWKTAKGKTRTAPVTYPATGNHQDKPRIVIRSGVWTAKYRNAENVIVEHSTGCRDETAARRVLSDLVRRVELVKSKLISAAENAAADYQHRPLAEHVEAYLDKLESDGVSPVHRENVERCLNRIKTDCRLTSLCDFTRDALEKWLARQARANVMAARTRNAYRSAAVAFANWCVETDRMPANELAKLKKADEKVDRRRNRRALTEAELKRLLEIARKRPLLDAMTVRRGPNKGKAVAKVSDATRTRLASVGRERALMYKTMVLTGLRKGELASLSVAQLDLGAAVPYLSLDAPDEKSREGNDIPLRTDLAAELQSWLDEKVRALQAQCRDRGEPIPDRLPADTAVFYVPSGLIRILDRDLRMAGIPKADDRGRTIDVHALRHSFGTLLSAAGVAPRTAQAAMRHSTIDLTMNTYTDPKLLDVHGALEMLPGLSPDASDVSAEIQTAAATGTDDGSIPFAPAFAPNSDNLVQTKPKGDKTADDGCDDNETETIGVTRYLVKQKEPLASVASGCLEVEPRGLEPLTSSLQS